MFCRNFDEIMNRFEPATPEQLSPSPMARKIGLDPVWEMENRANVSVKYILLFLTEIMFLMVVNFL